MTILNLKSGSWKLYNNEIETMHYKFEHRTFELQEWYIRIFQTRKPYFRNIEIRKLENDDSEV